MNKFKEDKPENCPVCLDEIDEKELLECGHYCHLDCIKKSNIYKCPICRHNVKIPFEERLENTTFNLHPCYAFIIIIIPYILCLIVGGIIVYKHSPSNEEYYKCENSHKVNLRECTFTLRREEGTEKQYSGEYYLVNGVEHQTYKFVSYNRYYLDINSSSHNNLILNSTIPFNFVDKYPYKYFLLCSNERCSLDRILIMKEKCYIKDGEFYFDYYCECTFYNLIKGWVFISVCFLLFLMFSVMWVNELTF